MRGGKRILAVSVPGIYVNKKCDYNEADYQYDHCTGYGFHC